MSFAAARLWSSWPACERAARRRSQSAMRRIAKVRLGDFIDQTKARADAKNMTAALEKISPDLQVDVEVIVDSAKPVVDLLFKEKTKK